MATPYKMKGHTLPGIKQKKGSALPKKPTSEEIFQAANDKNNPKHKSKIGDVAYQAWKGGSKIAKPRYHGAGGDIIRDDKVVGNLLKK